MMTLILEQVPGAPAGWRYHLIDERTREIYGVGETPSQVLHTAGLVAEQDHRFQHRLDAPLDRSYALLGAARVVESVVADLDETSTTCEHCARPSYRNWDEHRAGKELRAIVEKLRRFAAGLSAQEGPRAERVPS